MLKNPFSELIQLEDDYEKHFLSFEYLYALVNADLTAKEEGSSYFGGRPASSWRGSGRAGLAQL